MSVEHGIYLGKLLSNEIIVIVGPTASGKSELAQNLALEISGEIVSGDSMQIYKGLDIGTGKVVKSQQRVAHHLIDIIDPNESYSSALFQRDARCAFSEILSRGNTPILAGGTGFYIRTAIDDYNFSEGEQDNNSIREHYENYANSHSKQELWSYLQSKDPKSAHEIEINDTKRVIRALELFERGESYFENKQKLSEIKPKYNSTWIGLDVDRDILAKRISDRVDSMIEEGLVEEVKHLVELGFKDALCSPKAIGYREIVDYLNDKCSLHQAIVDIKTNTRRYAKRQRTWFRSEKRINWIDANDSDQTILLSEALRILNMV